MREERKKTPPIDLTGEHLLVDDKLVDGHYVLARGLIWKTIPIATKVILLWAGQRTLFEVSKIPSPESDLSGVWVARLFLIGKAPEIEPPVDEAQAKELASIIHGIVWSQEANCLEAARRILRAGYEKQTNGKN